MGRAQGTAAGTASASLRSRGFSLTIAQAAELRALRDEIRLDEGGSTDPAVAGGQCGVVSECVPGIAGLEAAEPFHAGAYLADNGNLVYDHCWNVLPDGTIVDVTADQFDEGDDLRVVAPTDSRFARYRDWSDLDVVAAEMSGRVDALVAEKGAAGRKQAEHELGEVSGYVFMEGGAGEFLGLLAHINRRHPGLKPAKPSWVR